MNRRGFLAGIIAAAAAPAIVRAGSIMPVYVPPAPKIITPADFNLGGGDWTMDAWVKDMRFTKDTARYQPTFEEPSFQHVALVLSGGVASHFVNGKRVTADHPMALQFQRVAKPIVRDRVIPTDVAGLQVDEFRLSSINRMKGIQ